MATQYTDEELGFIGAIGNLAGKALGGIGKGIKKAIQKKKKKPASKVIQMDATTIEGSTAKQATAEVQKAAAKLKSKGQPLTADAIAKQVAITIPGPVREIVLEALKAQSLNTVAKEQQMDSLAGQIDAAMEPKIAALLASLQAQELSRTATYEHNQLVQKAKFQDDTLNMLQAAFDKLQNIEARLAGSAVIPPGKINVFGARNVLEGR
jgi:hypothetical protein